MISRVLSMRLVTRWKKRKSKIKLFWHETWFGLQKLWKVGKINDGIWNYIKLSIIQDQPKHNSSIRLGLAREWRFVMQTSLSQIFAIADFTTCKSCNTAAKILVSPEKGLYVKKSAQKLSLELFSELIHHFQKQRYVVFFRPGRRGIPCSDWCCCMKMRSY